MEINVQSCCGTREIHHLPQSHFELLPRLVAYDRFHQNARYRFVIFTDSAPLTRGIRTAEYLRRHKLGPVKSTRIARNPNTGHDVKVWVWEIDEAQLRAFNTKYNSIPCKAESDPDNFDENTCPCGFCYFDRNFEESDRW